MILLDPPGPNEAAADADGLLSRGVRFLFEGLVSRVNAHERVLESGLRDASATTPELDQRSAGEQALRAAGLGLPARAPSDAEGLVAAVRDLQRRVAALEESG